jgi:hypothetical protein
MAMRKQGTRPKKVGTKAAARQSKTPRKTPPVRGIPTPSWETHRRRPATRQEPQPHGGSLSRNTHPDVPETDPAQPVEIHPLLARAGLVPGNPGNSGGKKGRSGRKPDAYYDLLEQLLHSKQTVESLRIALGMPFSPNFAGLVRELLNRLYGKPVQPHDHRGSVDHVIIMDA